MEEVAYCTEHISAYVGTDRGAEGIRFNEATDEQISEWKSGKRALWRLEVYDTNGQPMAHALYDRCELDRVEMRRDELESFDVDRGWSEAGAPQIRTIGL